MNNSYADLGQPPPDWKNGPGIYAVIPCSVRHARNLTDFQKLLYGEVSAYLDIYGKCYALDEEFAECYGKSVLSISRALKALHKNGYIKMKKIQGKRVIFLNANNQYRTTISG